MPDTLGNSGYVELVFDKDGVLQDQQASLSQLDQLAQVVDQLFIVSHGWKTVHSGARDAYRALWTPLEPVVSSSGSRWGVVGIIWPSAQFQWDREEIAADNAAGAAANVAAAVGSRDLSEQEAILRLDVLADLLDLDETVHKQLQDLLGRAGQDGAGSAAADNFVRQVARLSGIAGSNTADPELQASRASFSGSSEDILDALSLAVTPDATDVGGQAGLLDNVGNAIEGLFHGLAGVADFATFYKMKERAGKVGRSLGIILAERAELVAKAHLCGHSFGARLVTAAAAQLEIGQAVRSMTLMQAAFSQWGLSSQNQIGVPGAFSKVISQRHSARITITHTRKDWPLSYAYARASFLSNQVASAISGPQDKFGAMGANGAQGLQPGELSQVGGALADVTQKPRGASLVTNIKADSLLIRGHTDVWTDRMAALIAWSIR